MSSYTLSSRFAWSISLFVNTGCSCFRFQGFLFWRKIINSKTAWNCLKRIRYSNSGIIWKKILDLQSTSSLKNSFDDWSNCSLWYKWKFLEFFQIRIDVFNFFCKNLKIGKKIQKHLKSNYAMCTCFWEWIFGSSVFF